MELSLQEDFGNDCLLTLSDPYAPDILRETLLQLSLMQCLPFKQLPMLEEQQLIQQSRLMHSAFLESFLNVSIDQDFIVWLDAISAAVANQPEVNCHFDFERRNLFLLPERKIGVIDFQDLCIGPLGTDLAAFTVDHYESFHESRVHASCQIFLELTQMKYNKVDLVEMVLMAALQRNARILGVLSNLYLQQNRTFRLPDLEQILKNFIDISATLNMKTFSILDDALSMLPSKVTKICKQ